jgi:hypothetical protein
MEKNTLNELSQQEKTIIDNKSKYIQLEEDQSASLDVTKELLELSDKFLLGEIIHTPDFTLAETMASVELNHFKMDPHFNNREANTFRKLLKEGKIKIIEELTNREVNKLYNKIIRHFLLLITYSSLKSCGSTETRYIKLFSLLFISQMNQ